MCRAKSSRAGRQRPRCGSTIGPSIAAERPTRPTMMCQGNRRNSSAGFGKRRCKAVLCRGLGNSERKGRIGGKTRRPFPRIGQNSVRSGQKPQPRSALPILKPVGLLGDTASLRNAVVVSPGLSVSLCMHMGTENKPRNISHASTEVQARPEVKKRPRPQPHRSTASRNSGRPRKRFERPKRENSFDGETEIKTISIALVTWPRTTHRLTYFCRTVLGFLDHARASDHRFEFACSSELH